MQSRNLFLLSSTLFILTLGCGIAGFVQNPATLSGISYWAAETATPVPTQTIFLGMSTPVYADTPIPDSVTTVPFWTTVTATPIVPPATATPRWFSATPFWVTTTPAYITTTPQPPMTTTPSLPMIGFTTPEPLETPYYRVGTFYMNSDVYVDGPNGIVFRLVNHTQRASSNSPDATYHYLTLHVTNYSDTSVVVPASDLFFIRQIDELVGRWLPQNEPLIATGIPSYEAQQLTPLEPDSTREIVLGFVVPNGTVDEVGLITNWLGPIEGGLPIWFVLADDPAGPLRDAHKPPPPTSVVLDSGGMYAAASPSGTGWGAGRWPTTGIISRGFGCQDFFTGVDGAGFGCPAAQPWFHNGTDIADITGTAVWSPVDGDIIYAGPNSTGPDCSHIDGSEAPHQGLGNYQKIRGAETLHYFGHLNRFLLTAGSVSAGQHSAEMGSTGCSTGSHLHWIVYQNGNLVDPAQWAGGAP